LLTCPLARSTNRTDPAALIPRELSSRSELEVDRIVGQAHAPIFGPRIERDTHQRPRLFRQNVQRAFVVGHAHRDRGLSHGDLA
jgi:hypothetical protein